MCFLLCFCFCVLMFLCVKLVVLGVFLCLFFFVSTENIVFLCMDRSCNKYITLYRFLVCCGLGARKMRKNQKAEASQDMF